MVDELPEDLDVTRHVGEYRFPDVGRRRRLGIMYLAVSALTAAGAWSAGEGALGAAAGFLGLIGLYHLAASAPARVDETQALVTATRAVGFPVGHASAQLAFRGLRSRPTWRILLYSADEPPARRGLVEIDAVGGDVLGQFTEDNPEDWSQY